MEFKIDNSNYKDFISNNNQLVLDNAFIYLNNISDNCHILIEHIENDQLMLLVKDLKLSNLNIELRNSSLYGLFFENVILNEIKFISLNISVSSTEKFKNIKTRFNNSVLKSIYAHDSKFFNGFSITNQSEIENIRINESAIDYSFGFYDSNAEEITIESSIFNSLNFEKIDVYKKGINPKINLINIFRTEVNAGLKIVDIEFNHLSLYKFYIIKNPLLLDYKRDIFIALPEKQKKTQRIEFIECNIERKITIKLNDLNGFYTNNCIFNSFQFLFNKIAEFQFLNSTVNSNIIFIDQSCYKEIEKFSLNSCVINGQFHLSDTHFTEELMIQGTSFNTYPSFFARNTFSDNCIVNFGYSNLTNFIFQDIDFKIVSFKSIDIENASFNNCEWESDKKHFFFRYKVQDENNEIITIDDLLTIKSIYSKLKSSFRKNTDYINSGRFYISEQEVKKAISRYNSNFFENLLLSIHKSISSYGESVSKPLLLLFFLICISAVIYLFTGFNSGDRLISYTFILNLNNTSQTMHDFVLSIVFSLKNIVPFSMGNNFFLNSLTRNLTQVIELIQKIISLILLASFSESFIRYLKK